MDSNGIKIRRLFTILLLLIYLRSAATININCDEKPFHCVNSTHFMICVDLGGGITKTVDDFIIQCPATTTCKASNHFECEYQPPATTESVIHLEHKINESEIDTQAATTSGNDIVDTFNPFQQTNEKRALNENYNAIDVSTYPDPIADMQTYGLNEILGITRKITSTDNKMSITNEHFDVLTSTPETYTVEKYNGNNIFDNNYSLRLLVPSAVKKSNLDDSTLSYSTNSEQTTPEIQFPLLITNEFTETNNISNETILNSTPSFTNFMQTYNTTTDSASNDAIILMTPQILLKETENLGSSNVSSRIENKSSIVSNLDLAEKIAKDNLINTISPYELDISTSRNDIVETEMPFQQSNEKGLLKELYNFIDVTAHTDLAEDMQTHRLNEILGITQKRTSIDNKVLTINENFDHFTSTPETYTVENSINTKVSGINYPFRLLEPSAIKNSYLHDSTLSYSTNAEQIIPEKESTSVFTDEFTKKTNISNETASNSTTSFTKFMQTYDTTSDSVSNNAVILTTPQILLIETENFGSSNVSSRIENKTDIVSHFDFESPPVITNVLNEKTLNSTTSYTKFMETYDTTTDSESKDAFMMTTPQILLMESENSGTSKIPSKIENKIDIVSQFDLPGKITKDLLPNTSSLYELDISNITEKKFTTNAKFSNSLTNNSNTLTNSNLGTLPFFSKPTIIEHLTSNKQMIENTSYSNTLSENTMFLFHYENVTKIFRNMKLNSTVPNATEIDYNTVNYINKVPTPYYKSSFENETWSSESKSTIIQEIVTESSLSLRNIKDKEKFMPPYTNIPVSVTPTIMTDNYYYNYDTIAYPEYQAPTSKSTFLEHVIQSKNVEKLTPHDQHKPKITSPKDIYADIEDTSNSSLYTPLLLMTDYFATTSSSILESDAKTIEHVSDSSYVSKDDVYDHEMFLTFENVSEIPPQMIASTVLNPINNHHSVGEQSTKIEMLPIFDKYYLTSETPVTTVELNEMDQNIKHAITKESIFNNKTEDFRLLYEGTPSLVTENTYYDGTAFTSNENQTKISELKIMKQSIPYNKSNTSIPHGHRISKINNLNNISDKAELLLSNENVTILSSLPTLEQADTFIDHATEAKKLLEYTTETSNYLNENQMFSLQHKNRTELALKVIETSKLFNSTMAVSKTEKSITTRMPQMPIFSNENLPYEIKPQETNTFNVISISSDNINSNNSSTKIKNNKTSIVNLMKQIITENKALKVSFPTDIFTTNVNARNSLPKTASWLSNDSFTTLSSINILGPALKTTEHQINRKGAIQSTVVNNSDLYSLQYENANKTSTSRKINYLTLPNYYTFDMVTESSFVKDNSTLAPETVDGFKANFVEESENTTEPNFSINSTYSHFIPIEMTNTSFINHNSDTGSQLKNLVLPTATVQSITENIIKNDATNLAKDFHYFMNGMIEPKRDEMYKDTYPVEVITKKKEIFHDMDGLQSQDQPSTESSNPEGHYSSSTEIFIIKIPFPPNNSISTVIAKVDDFTLSKNDQIITEMTTKNHNLLNSENESSLVSQYIHYNITTNSKAKQMEPAVFLNTSKPNSLSSATLHNIREGQENESNFIRGNNKNIKSFITDTAFNISYEVTTENILINETSHNLTIRPTTNDFLIDLINMQSEIPSENKSITYSYKNNSSKDGHTLKNDLNNVTEDESNNIIKNVNKSFPTENYTQESNKTAFAKIPYLTLPMLSNDSILFHTIANNITSKYLTSKVNYNKSNTSNEMSKKRSILPNTEAQSQGTRIKIRNTLNLNTDQSKIMINKQNITTMEQLLLKIDAHPVQPNATESTLIVNSNSQIDIRGPEKNNNNNNRTLHGSVKKEEIMFDIRTKSSITTSHGNKTVLLKTNSVDVKLQNNINVGVRINQSSVNYDFFTCKDRLRGRYPDKDDCKKFYICIGKVQPICGECPSNTVFSEIKKHCTKNLSHCTRNNQFHCIEEGTFSDVLRSNIYYICVRIKNTYVRYQLQCQNGYDLNKTTVRCENNMKFQSQVTSRSNDNDSNKGSEQRTHEKSKEKKRTTHVNEHVTMCKDEGKFPDPNDCRRYYVCTKNSKSIFRRKTKKCDSDEVFNREKNKCVDSDSYECN